MKQINESEVRGFLDSHLDFKQKNKTKGKDATLRTYLVKKHNPTERFGRFLIGLLKTIVSCGIWLKSEETKDQLFFAKKTVIQVVRNGKRDETRRQESKQKESKAKSKPESLPINLPIDTLKTLESPVINFEDNLIHWPYVEFGCCYLSQLKEILANTPELKKATIVLPGKLKEEEISRLQENIALLLERNMTITIQIPKEFRLKEFRKKVQDIYIAGLLEMVGTKNLSRFYQALSQPSKEQVLQAILPSLFDNDAVGVLLNNLPDQDLAIVTNGAIEKIKDKVISLSEFDLLVSFIDPSKNDQILNTLLTHNPQKVKDILLGTIDAAYSHEGEYKKSLNDQPLGFHKPINRNPGKFVEMAFARLEEKDIKSLADQAIQKRSGKSQREVLYKLLRYAESSSFAKEYFRQAFLVASIAEPYFDSAKSLLQSLSDKELTDLTAAIINKSPEAFFNIVLYSEGSKHHLLLEALFNQEQDKAINVILALVNAASRFESKIDDIWTLMAPKPLASQVGKFTETAVGRLSDEQLKFLVQWALEQNGSDKKETLYRLARFANTNEFGRAYLKKSITELVGQGSSSLPSVPSMSNLFSVERLKEALEKNPEIQEVPLLLSKDWYDFRSKAKLLVEQKKTILLQFPEDVTGESTKKNFDMVFVKDQELSSFLAALSECSKNELVLRLLPFKYTLGDIIKNLSEQDLQKVITFLLKQDNHISIFHRFVKSAWKNQEEVAKAILNRDGSVALIQECLSYLSENEAKPLRKILDRVVVQLPKEQLRPLINEIIKKDGNRAPLAIIELLKCALNFKFKMLSTQEKEVMPQLIALILKMPDSDTIIFNSFELVNDHIHLFYLREILERGSDELIQQAFSLRYSEIFFNALITAVNTEKKLALVFRAAASQTHNDEQRTQLVKTLCRASVPLLPIFNLFMTLPENERVFKDIFERAAKEEEGKSKVYYVRVIDEKTFDCLKFYHIIQNFSEEKFSVELETLLSQQKPSFFTSHIQECPEEYWESAFKVLLDHSQDSDKSDLACAFLRDTVTVSVRGVDLYLKYLDKISDQESASLSVLKNFTRTQKPNQALKIVHATAKLDNQELAERVLRHVFISYVNFSWVLKKSDEILSDSSPLKSYCHDLLLGFEFYMEADYKKEQLTNQCNLLKTNRNAFQFFIDLISENLQTQHIIPVVFDVFLEFVEDKPAFAKSFLKTQINPYTDIKERLAFVSYFDHLDQIKDDEREELNVLKSVLPFIYDLTPLIKAISESEQPEATKVKAIELIIDLLINKKQTKLPEKHIFFACLDLPKGTLLDTFKNNVSPLSFTCYNYLKNYKTADFKEALKDYTGNYVELEDLLLKECEYRHISTLFRVLLDQNSKDKTKFVTKFFVRFTPLDDRYDGLSAYFENLDLVSETEGTDFDVFISSLKELREKIGLDEKDFSYIFRRVLEKLVESKNQPLEPIINKFIEGGFLVEHEIHSIFLRTYTGSEWTIKDAAKKPGALYLFKILLKICDAEHFMPIFEGYLEDKKEFSQQAEFIKLYFETLLNRAIETNDDSVIFSAFKAYAKNFSLIKIAPQTVQPVVLTKVPSLRDQMLQKAVKTLKGSNKPIDLPEELSELLMNEALIKGTLTSKNVKLFTNLGSSVTIPTYRKVELFAEILERFAEKSLITPVTIELFAPPIVTPVHSFTEKVNLLILSLKNNQYPNLRAVIKLLKPEMSFELHFPAKTVKKEEV